MSSDSSDYSKVFGEKVKKAGGVILLGAGIGVGFWACIVLSDILTFVWVYCTVGNVMDEYSINEYLGKLIAVAFAAGVTYLANMIFVRIIKRDKRWAPMVAGLMASWFVVMYFVSSPYGSGLFNPFNGQARAVYLRMSDGTIKSFPKGLKFDPDTGRQLKEFDPATAEEYQKQQVVKKKVAAHWKSPSDSNNVTSKDEEDNLVLWVEKMQLAPSETIVYLACEGRNGGAGILRVITDIDGIQWKGQYHNITVTGTYLVDNWGQSYNPRRCSAVYSTETSGWGPWEDFQQVRRVRVDEIYRFTLHFPALPQQLTQLRLHLANLKPALELDAAFTQAEKIPPIPQAPPTPPG